MNKISVPLFMGAAIGSIIAGLAVAIHMAFAPDVSFWMGVMIASLIMAASFLIRTKIK